MNISMAISCFKLRKYRKWEKYLEFVKSFEKNPPKELLEKPTMTFKKPVTEDLFNICDMHKTLSKKYDLQNVAGSGTDLDRALNVMHWLTDNTYYLGVVYRWRADNSVDILKNSFGKGFANGICCREKAIVLSDCLLAVGIKAYPILLVTGGHFVVHFYSNEREKWILLDPSFNCYFEYKSEILDIWELRSCLLRDEDVRIVDYSFNNTDECKDVYMKYFIKQSMTDISTWTDNSMDRRALKKYDWDSKKAFDTALPK